MPMVQLRSTQDCRQSSLSFVKPVPCFFLLAYRLFADDLGAKTLSNESSDRQMLSTRSGSSMNPETKRIVEDEQRKKIFTDCSEPETDRADAQNKHNSMVTVQVSKPDSRRYIYSNRADAQNKRIPEITVQVSKPDSRQYNHWKLDKVYSDNPDTNIQPMRNWTPKGNCRTVCTCYPAQALQVYELSISSRKDVTVPQKAHISGFFAIRDYYDRLRIYIFDRRNDRASIEFTNGVGKVRITPPHRGILYGDLVFEYELTITYATLEGTYDESIEDKELYLGKSCPYSSNPIIVHAPIPTKSDSKMKEINLKFVRFSMGIEAEIEIQPPEGLKFRLTAHLGSIGDEIMVYDSECSMPNVTVDQEPLKELESKRKKSFKYVLVVPLLSILELRFVFPNHPDDEKVYKFHSIYHGSVEQDISINSRVINMKIKWSRM